ncbi:amino-acid N-acetyltransferase [Neisseria sp. Ec49-e6-T10]|uniref:amino-acid N-acetyltransferase n=1 Tax=Neisseria sp. Ec49-e6-T10 TaxID=3140744 RepID=UPI003EC1243D
MNNPNAQFIALFREAAPYIHQFRDKTFVIGLSGHTLLDKSIEHIAQDIGLLASLGVRLVLVHGARPQIETALQAHQIASVVHKHTRVTDLPTLSIIKQVFGAARFDIEANLSMGMPNSPMYGAGIKTASGNFITAKPLGVLDGIDMQLSGTVRKVDKLTIQKRLDEGCVVLVSPLGYSLSGETFNLKMEEVASQIAQSLQAEKLIYLIEGQGLFTQEQTLISSLSAQEAQAVLHNTPQAQDVTIALPFAIKALNNGVSRAHLLSAKQNGVLLSELFTRTGSGTSIARSAFVQIREATIDDIPSIMAIIQPLEEAGILRKRSRETIENHIQSYSVLVNDNQIYGCIAIKTFAKEPDMAELACLAVAPITQESGYGQLLVNHLEQKAFKMGVRKLFLLTTQTAHWFIERGFKEATLADLPKEKQKLYNYERRSKILMKNLVN